LINARIKLFEAGLAESVAKFCFGMLADVFFELLPESAIITDFLA
jgi:hypothetical protein